MASNKKTGRVVGVLLLIIFALGVTIYQVLQAAVLFKEDFYTVIYTKSDEIILSVVLGFLSGLLSIGIAVFVLPIFKKQNVTLAYLYLVFCVFTFVAIAIDNIAVLSMLELGNQFAEGESSNQNLFEALVKTSYQRHWQTHHISLLVSCLPVFVLFLNLYLSKLVLRALSIFGMLAAILMFAEMLATVIGSGISENLMFPIALIQLVFPFWLMVKGFKTPQEIKTADLD